MNAQSILESSPVELVTQESELSKVYADIKKSLRVAVDTETHGETSFLNGLWSKLRVIAIGIKLPGSYKSYVVDVKDISVESLANLMATIEVADAWNANFDQAVLELYGCDVKSWRDAMFTDSIIHSGITGFEFWHSLAHSAKKFLNVEMLGKGSTQVSFDGSTPLTEEQIRYAGFDALITLMLAEKLDSIVSEKGLEIPVDLEQKARPFILQMMNNGMPFDSESWNSEVIKYHEKGRADALLELANLTGGGEITLFGETNEPPWNPDSDQPTREALNTYAREAVHAYTKGRDLNSSDKVDKTTLKQIEHPLAEALLRYRGHAKVLSTYGDNLNKYIHNGRIRPQYKQGGVVATGRLASDKPNAQNLDPAMKKYIRPPDRVTPSGEKVKRAFVYADLSQAELRVLAQVSNEERMRELFRLGGDFHARTAGDMFRVDMDELKEADAEAYSLYRKKSKGVNFGIPYGLGAAALATNLSVNSGVLTTASEAQAMLDSYAKAYPNVNGWLSARDDFVKNCMGKHDIIDWNSSFTLHEQWNKVDSARKVFKKHNGRFPSSLEILESLYSSDELSSDDFKDSKLKEVNWVLSFDRPVLVTHEGDPFVFESRTLTGRRRLFAVPLDSSPKDKFEGIITSAAILICTSDKQPVADLRQRFADRHYLDLPKGIYRCKKKPNESDRDYRNRSFEFRKRERIAVVKAFEGAKKPLKYELLRFVEENLQDDNGNIIGASAVRGYLLPMAFADQIKAKNNQFRNHPNQSLVADIGFQYYADLYEILQNYTEAYPIQAVHDSIAIECDLSEAFALRDAVQQSLENAMAYWCPDVPAKADSDVRTSLADRDVIEHI